MTLALNDNEILGPAQLKYYEMNIFPGRKHWLGGVYIHEKHQGKKLDES